MVRARSRPGPEAGCARPAERPGRLTAERASSEQKAAKTIVLDKAPSPAPAAVGRAPAVSAEPLPPSASAGPAPGIVSARAPEPMTSQGEEQAADRAAGPEGSLHWAPWGWQ